MLLIYKRWAHGLFSARLPSSFFYAGEGGSLLPPHRPAVRRRPCQRETRRQPPGSVSACSCSLMPARAAMFFSRTWAVGPLAPSFTVAESCLVSFSLPHRVFSVKFVWVFENWDYACCLNECCFFSLFRIWYIGMCCFTLYFLQFDGNVIMSRLAPCWLNIYIR